MIKSFLMSLTFLGSFVFSFFFVEGINVNTNQPAEVNPGDEFTYEITIDKPGIMGFAKVQQQWPEGFTAEAIETKSASFSSVAGKVKFIWMSLPSDEQFTISYKVKVAESVPAGEVQVEGRFSFLVDNVKDSKEIPTTMINVKSPAAPIAENTESPEDTPTETTAGSESASNESSSGQDAVTAQATASNKGGSESTSAGTNNNTSASGQSTASQVAMGGASGDDKIKVVRSITPMAEEGKYKVTYDITNNGLTGFAKLQDVLPGEMMAYEEDPKSAVYSFSNRKSKFVWMSFPEDKQFQVSYMAVANNQEELEQIGSEFSYLDDNETKRFAVAPGTGNSDDQLASASTPTQTTQNNSTPSTPSASGTGNASTSNTTPTNTSANKQTNTPVAASGSAGSSTGSASEGTSTQNKPKGSSANRISGSTPSSTKSSNKNTGTSASTQSPSSQNMGSIATSNKGIGYKVQVMANKRSLKDVPKFFKKTYSYNETKVSVENHQGWIKYTVNNYDNYKSARDRRNQVTAAYQFPGPFVTAYNNGKRITVQEALMITRDKWMP